MLIRSQDGDRLLNFEMCNYIYLGSTGENYVWIFADVDGEEFVMGYYAGTARCREVLNEIQTFYEHSKVAEVYSMKPMFVYQMPEE